MFSLRTRKARKWKRMIDEDEDSDDKDEEEDFEEEDQ